MSEEFIKNLLGNINYEIETDTNWVEPLGLDRDTWKELLNYIQQKENIIKEVREYVENNLYGDYGYECKQSKKELLEILDKGEDKE